MHRYFNAKITRNDNLNKHFILLSATPYITTLAPIPGQFYMLQAGCGYDPLLKRPFSIFRTEQLSSRAISLSFLYRIRGKGTCSLSRLKEGDDIRIIGPLGNGYPKPEGDFIAVAGGIGIASLLPLIESHKGRAYLFYGARSKEELVMLNEARISSKEIFVATDDGSEGQKGQVTDLLKNFFEASCITHHASCIYACGPLPMLRELYNVIADKDIECYVSLEEHMACGVGACLGCVVKSKQRAPNIAPTEWIYKRVCKEGPVFDIREILWE